MSNAAVCKAIENETPLNALYALTPEKRRKALDRFMRLFGKSPADLQDALSREGK